MTGTGAVANTGLFPRYLQSLDARFHRDLGSDNEPSEFAQAFGDCIVSWLFREPVLIPHAHVTDSLAFLRIADDVHTTIDYGALAGPDRVGFQPFVIGKWPGSADTRRPAGSAIGDGLEDTLVNRLRDEERLLSGLIGITDQQAMRVHVARTIEHDGLETAIREVELESPGAAWTLQLIQSLVENQASSGQSPPLIRASR